MHHQLLQKEVRDTDQPIGNRHHRAKHLKHWAVAIVLCLMTLAAGRRPAEAQQSATLSGTVNDNSGAVIGGARIELTNEASGIVRNTVTNGSGFYTLAAIPPGSYKVTVTANGFKQYSQDGVVFTEGQSRTLPDLKLAVGSESQQVIVTGQDGYSATIGMGEIDPEFENKQVILATERDGKAIDIPRLAIPGDKRAGRSVRDVASIVVR